VSARTGSISVGQVAPNGSVTSLVSGQNLTCLAFSPDGKLYVANPEDGHVYQVSPAGALTLFVTLNSNNDAGISHMAFDSSGNMYVTNWQINGVNKVTPGGVISTYATGTEHPTGLAFDSKGTLYVSSEVPNGYVTKITPGGVSSTFATLSHYGEGLAFDSSGNLYVADTTYPQTSNDTSSQVDKITSDGVVSTFATGFNHPQGLAFDSSGNLYVAEYWSGTVSMVGPGGGTAKLFATGFSGTESIAFAPAAVPEPASFALLGTAIATLAGYGVIEHQRRNRDADSSVPT
jgi:sugar lactone lactonase YvrE